MEDDKFGKPGGNVGSDKQNVRIFKVDSGALGSRPQLIWAENDRIAVRKSASFSPMKLPGGQTAKASDITSKCKIEPSESKDKNTVKITYKSKSYNLEKEVPVEAQE